MLTRRWQKDSWKRQKTQQARLFIRFVRRSADALFTTHQDGHARPDDGGRIVDWLDRSPGSFRGTNVRVGSTREPYPVNRSAGGFRSGIRPSHGETTRASADGQTTDR